MKVLKISALILAGLIVAVLLIGSLAFLPAVQTWAVRKALAGQPGLAVEVGRVAAGFSTAEIGDLHVVKDGLVITAKNVSARYSAWDYLRHKRINVDDVAVQGLTVDARHYAPAASAPVTAPATTVAAPFGGLLSLAQLPLDVRVARLAVDGRALLPGERTVAFTVTGGGIETGQRARLEWKIDFTDPQKDARLRALHTTGTLALHLTADRRIDAVEIENSAAAEGPNLPADRVKLEAKAEQAAAGANETYTARLSLVRQDKIEPLLNAQVEFLQASREFAGTWDLTVRSEQVAALLAGLGLPEIAVNGAGKFTFKPDTNAAAASGELTGRVAGMEKLYAQLAVVGPLQLRAAFDGGFAAPVARLSRLELEVSTADGRQLLQVTTAQPVSFNVADQKLALTNPGAELARISLQKLPLAWVGPFVKPIVIESGDLSLVLAIEAEPDGSRARVRTIQPLTLNAVTVRDGDRKLVDQMTLSFSPSLDYSATGITAEVPDLKLSLPAGDSTSGKIAVEVTNFTQTPVVAFSAQMSEKLVSVLKPYLPLDPGPLAVETSLAGRLAGKNLQIAQLAVTVKRDNGALLLAVDALQPIAVNLDSVRASAPDANAAAVRLRLGEVPLAWAEVFVPKSKFAGVLSGGTFEVTLRGPDDFAVQTTAPVTVRGVGVILDGQALAQALDIDADFSATKRADAFAGELRRLEVKQGAVSLARLTATGEARLGAKLTASGKGKLEADVAALTKQPALASFATLARGNVTTTFDVSLADTMQTKATVAVRNLTARPGNQALGNLDFSVDANVKADASSGTVKLPLTLAVGDRKSDLLLDGSFSRTATSVTFNGKLTSNRIVADDFQALALLAPPSPAPVAATPKPVPAKPTPTAAPARSSGPTAPAAPATAAATRDTEPFWQGVASRFEVDLKQVQYGPDYIVSGIRGALTIDATHLALENLEGKFKDNPFKVSAGITFTAKQAQPYALNGLVNIPGFDVGAFLRAAAPNEPPALETKVTIAAQLDGHGATLPALLQNTLGQFDVTGTAGVLRALSQKNFSGKAAGAVSTLGRLAALATNSDTTAALTELLSEMDEMKFDRFTMHVERGADLNLKLTSLEFVSPDKHLTGSGRIEYRRDTPVQDQPLHVDMQLAAKDHTAVLLNRLGKLNNQQDAQGYYPMNRAFVITGTPSNPDSSDFQKFLREVAVEQGTKALLKLLSR